MYLRLSNYIYFFKLSKFQRIKTVTSVKKKKKKKFHSTDVIILAISLAFLLEKNRN